jgi:diguanylate cyclase (GGDEF)-like protein
MDVEPGQLPPGVHRAVLRWIVFMTAAAVAASLLITCAVGYFTHGAVLTDATGWIIAVLAPLLIAPTASYAHVALAHRLKHANQRLKSLSETDPLTNTLNRRKFVEVAQQELHRARRSEVPTSIVLFDFDHFKQVNDRYGHLRGDDALVHVIGVMQAMIRESDVLARFGGEEFILLLPHTEPEGATSLVRRILRAVGDNPLCVGGAEIPVTLSAGIVTCETSQTGLDTMMSRADALLYESKQNGRNQMSADLLTCPWPRRQTA